MRYPGCGSTQECGTIGNVCSLPGAGRQHGTKEGEERTSRQFHGKQKLTLFLCRRLGDWAGPGLPVKCVISLLGRGDKSTLFFISLFFINLFIYLWQCWVFVSVRGLSLVAASGGHSSSRCAGLSLSRPLLLQSTGSRRAGSVVVAHGSSCSAECGIFPDQGSNPCPLHWQADS